MASEARMRTVDIPAGMVLVPRPQHGIRLFWPGGAQVGEHPDPWGREPADRWVRLFATFGSDGVWRVDGIAGTADELPISNRLIHRIRRWQAWYDSAVADEPGGTPWEKLRPDRAQRFNIVTRHLGRALKAELPPDWTVLAVDIDGWCRNDDEDHLLLSPDRLTDDRAHGRLA